MVIWMGSITLYPNKRLPNDEGPPSGNCNGALKQMLTSHALFYADFPPLVPKLHLRQIVEMFNIFIFLWAITQHMNQFDQYDQLR
ncbi:hypothetical protein HZ326_21482 [Fusarium oxysporum f. sp. albedinis]|nr:Glutathione S-transferase omega-like 2 [Fusarium oxysporum f. sp. albedinis]KAJ0135482.1 hypothetical protein HZ326_21482 [Fusarium oxysporum f. sp. albedinis]